VTDLAPTDVVLSPSGGAVAVLWEFTYQPDPASLELYHNYIMAFYHAADARFAYARRLSDQPPGGSPAPESGPIPVDLTISSLAPYASLMGHTEAPLWNRIIWSADGTGVFVVETVSDTAVYLAWEPSAPDPPQPVQPARVPASAIPTASGPVGPHGRAAVISSAGNESTLTIRELTAWTAFGDAGTIPVADATY
jgi:hypothetical protein